MMIAYDCKWTEIFEESAEDLLKAFDADRQGPQELPRWLALEAATIIGADHHLMVAHDFWHRIADEVVEAAEAQKSQPESTEKKTTAYLKDAKSLLVSAEHYHARAEDGHEWAGPAADRAFLAAQTNAAIAQAEALARIADCLERLQLDIERMSS